MFTKDDLIFVYTRKQAIADGTLIDVSTMAREAGFVYPVAITAAAWAECVAVSSDLDGQDEKGRLWDVLNLLRFAIRRPGSNASEIRFQVSVRQATGSLAVKLKAICGPDDEADPCVTIMLPDED